MKKTKKEMRNAVIIFRFIWIFMTKTTLNGIKAKEMISTK